MPCLIKSLTKNSPGLVSFTFNEMNSPLFNFSGQKVEAMVFIEPYLKLMTDNESFGSTFYDLDISFLK